MIYSIAVQHCSCG